MRSSLAGVLARAFAAALLAASAADAQPPARGPQAWAGCCGLAPWPRERPAPRTSRSGSSPLFRGYANIVAGSALRHRLALNGAIPAPYATMRNPLPATPENARRGAAIYEARCASCHGALGLGDGPASRSLVPQPAELSWITQLPPSRWDAFMYWSTAAGGAAYQTPMPAFKGVLSDDEIWSVVGYIQARLPKARTTAR
jgi:mono/diheme cytochrome c family protein